MKCAANVSKKQAPAKKVVKKVMKKIASKKKK